MHIKNVENGARTRKLWILQVRGPKCEVVRPPRRGTSLPRPDKWLRASNQWKRIGLTPHDVAIPCHDVAHPKNAPISRFQGLWVPLLSSFLSRAETLRLSPRDPPTAPVFTFKSRRKVLCSRDSRVSRDFPAFSALPVEVLLDSSLDYFKSTTSIKWVHTP